MRFATAAIVALAFTTPPGIAHAGAFPDARHVGRAVPARRHQQHHGARHRDKMSETLGQPVVVENRGGGAAVRSHAAGREGAPDGYTLLLAYTSNLASGPNLFPMSATTRARTFRRSASSASASRAGGASVAGGAFGVRS